MCVAPRRLNEASIKYDTVSESSLIGMVFVKFKKPGWFIFNTASTLLKATRKNKSKLISIIALTHYSMRVILRLQQTVVFMPRTGIATSGRGASLETGRSVSCFSRRPLLQSTISRTFG